MSIQFKIGDFLAGEFINPYIIAEIGVNHEGNLDLARTLIEQAAEGGAHAAKFQSYKAEKIASRHSPAYWDSSKEPTRSQYELFKKYDAFGERDYERLAEHCRDCGVDFISTPFDLDAVDFLEPLVPAYKIASADITNIPLLRKCAAKGKPLIISTGAATLPEIENTIGEVRGHGATDIALLHCVLNYPTPVEAAQLNMIHTLERVFPDCMIGYSDHVVPDETMTAMEAGMLVGARILEKHFTHDKSLPGNDHYHAMDVRDLSLFNRRLKVYQAMFSSGEKKMELESAARLHARRSIVAARDISCGETLSEENLIAKRPGHGISPLFWDEVLGSSASRDIAQDELLDWGSFSRMSLDGH